MKEAFYFVKKFFCSILVFLINIFATYISFIFCFTLMYYPHPGFGFIANLPPIEVIWLYASLFAIPTVLSALVRFMLKHDLLFPVMGKFIPFVSLVLTMVMNVFLAYLVFDYFADDIKSIIAGTASVYLGDTTVIAAKNSILGIEQSVNIYNVFKDTEGGIAFYVGLRMFASAHIVSLVRYQKNRQQKQANNRFNKVFQKTQSYLRRRAAAPGNGDGNRQG